VRARSGGDHFQDGGGGVDNKKSERRVPELLVGAGTVLTTDNLNRAFDAGAKFAVAPGFNPTVVREAVKRGLPFMPGISCATHIEQAMELSLRHFKFFPAEPLGGVTMLKAIAAPYKHLGVGFFPTGGINPDNAMSYLAMPEVIACGGTWLGKSADIAAGKWDKIESEVRNAVVMLAKRIL